MTARRTLGFSFSLGIGMQVALLAAGCGKVENNVPISTAALTTGSPSEHAAREPENVSGGIVNTSAPPGAHANYYGGRVVSNMNVVQVIYGAGSYLAGVTGSGPGGRTVGTFYQGVLNSPYVDWLVEYNTNTQPGTRTNQIIGRGSFTSQVTITPASAASTISDASIQTELSNQIVAGVLPPPTHDAAGNNNTYYAIFFPHGKTITQGGSASCVSGGFCAYHGTIANVPGFGEVYYGVHPDMQAGSGCDVGCGNAALPFDNMTSVASHEMVETITDPEVGLATTFGPPLAWYDPTYGEVSDTCNAIQGSVVGSDGLTYTVQTTYSNVANDCIVTRPLTNDFSITTSPTRGTLTAGATGRATINTTTVSGSAQTVALSVTGAPAGVTTSFSPTSVTSGGSSTLTVVTTTGAPNGTFNLVVTGTAASGFHTATIALTITGGTTASDFSIGASPASVSIAAGAAGGSTISTATTSGAAQTVALSISGLPAGVTASFSPASVTSGGSAALTLTTTSTAAPGTYPLTVTGTAASGSHTTALSLIVTPAAANDFSLIASPATVSIVAGGLAGSSTISTATTSGNAQTVALSISGLPAGVTASLSPSSVTSGGSAALTLTAAAGTTPGMATLTITGAASSGTHTTTVALTVTAPAVNDFSIASSPTQGTLTAGTTGRATISTATISGSAQTVAFTISGVPAGVTASFSPTSVTSGGSSTLTIATTTSAARGTFPLVVTGTAASGAHTVTVTLTIR